MAAGKRRFDVFVSYIIDHIEGGWDKHGPTQWGINAPANPDLAPLIRAGRLPRDTAVRRYREVYWPQVPRRESMALPVSFFVFDRVIQGTPRPFVDRVVSLKLLALGVKPAQVSKTKARVADVGRSGTVLLTDKTAQFLETYPDLAMVALIKWLRQERTGAMLRGYVKKEPASVAAMSNRLHKVARAMEALWGRKIS